MAENFLKRPLALAKYQKLREKHSLILIEGLRGVGKSTFLRQIAAQLMTEGVGEEALVFVDFEGLRYGESLDTAALRQYAEKMLSAGRELYLFLDELTDAALFDEIVGALYLNRRLHIIIAASNGGIAEQELAGVLSGGFGRIVLLPLSFGEALAQIAGVDLANYMAHSALPAAILAGDFGAKVLKSLLDGIFYREILLRRHLRDGELIADFMTAIPSSSAGSLRPPPSPAASPTWGARSAPRPPWTTSRH